MLNMTETDRRLTLFENGELLSEPDTIELIQTLIDDTKSWPGRSKKVRETALHLVTLGKCRWAHRI